MATFNYSPTQRRPILRDAIYEREYGVIPESSPARGYRSSYLNNDGGLAATAAPSLPPLTVDPAKEYIEQYNTTGETPKVDPGQTGGTGQVDPIYRSGPNERVANITAIGGLGLGALSYLENRKTSKLQREALRHDIDTAKEHRANRQALGASFSAGLASGLGGGNK